MDASSFPRLRLTTPLLALASTFIAAGGFIHLREWLEVYRGVPASAPGSAVVRIGFPLTAVASVLVVLALGLAIRRRSRLIQPVILVALVMQAGSLAVLIATRMGSVLGWFEPIWTPGAEQTRAVEIAAIVALAALALAARADMSLTDGVRPALDAKPVARRLGFQEP